MRMHAARVATAIASLAWAAGCATLSGNSDTGEEASPEVELNRYESDFRPSDYDPDPTAGSPVAPPTPPGTDPVAIDTTVTFSREMAPGYRVQIFSSTNIDTAKARMAEAETAVPTEWFYLDFDPPVYKIRAGNFRTKYEADRFARAIAEKGFRDAWSVPTRIFLNPPPPYRPPTPPEEN